MSPRPERRRSNLLVQLGQTLLVIGAAVLVVGLVLRGGDHSVWVGLLLLVVGLPLFVLGLRRQRRATTSVPPPSGPPGA